MFGELLYEYNIQRVKKKDFHMLGLFHSSNNFTRVYML